MFVYVVFSTITEQCEVFESYSKAEEFKKRNSYTHWLIAQRDIRKN